MPPFRLKPTVSLLFLTGLISPVVAAQDSASEIQEIIVDGRYLSIDKMNAVKTQTPIIDVPQSLSIISSEQIDEQAFRNFGDILRYTPGLSISQGEGHRDAIIIRGMQSTADFFIDGVRDDVQYYRPLYNVEQVEILRGSNALLFGRGGGGGVINRVSKQAMFGENFSAINSGVDTFGAWSVAGDLNIGTSDNSAFRLNAYLQELDSHRDFYEGESYALNPTFRVSLGPATSGVLSYEYVNDDRVVDRGVPSMNVVNGPDVPLVGFPGTFFGSPEGNRTALKANIFRARLDHEFADTLRGNLSAIVADYDKSYQNLYTSEEVALNNGVIPQVELDGYRDLTNRDNAIFQANLVGEWMTGNLRHTVLVGGEYGSQESSNSRFDNVFAVNGADQLTMPFSDPLVIPAFTMNKLVRNGASDVEFLSVYFQDQLDLTEQFKLVLGFRYDEFDIRVLDAIEENDGDAQGGRFQRKDDEITPRVGAIFKPAENVSIYASYSETFLPRSGDQFLTLDLDSQSTRPQFFENLEGGIKWDIRPDLSATAALFTLERESYTSVDPEDPAQLILIEGSKTNGLELQLTGNLTETWSATAGYAWLDGKVLRVDGSGSAGNKTRQTPEHMFSVWNNFQVNRNLAFGLGVTYQDSFFVSEDNSVEVPDYTRVDAGVFYDMSSRVRLQLNIENLFDESYYPDAHSNDNISTGKPLNARLSLRAMF
jgi:catecholate siderophore receptor